MAKRANGLGSIYKDKTSGRWVGAITIDDGGRRRRRKVTGRTQKVVEERLEQLRRSVDIDAALPAEMTVARFLEYWIDDVLPDADIGPTTREQYERIVRLYIIPNIGRVKLVNLAPSHVRKMLTKLRNTETDGSRRRRSRAKDKGKALPEPEYLSPGTRRQARSVLSRSLRTAEADGLVTRNAARLTDGVKQDERKGRALTPEQARTLLSAAQGHEYGAVVVVLLSLGLRKGEALGLSWADVDLDSTPAQLQIRQTLKKDGRGGLYLGEPKTHTSRRTVHLPQQTVATLRSHRKAQTEARLAFGAGWGGEWAARDLVFTNSVGGPVDPDRLNRAVQKLADDAGLGKWTPHELRHSAASLLAAQGVPLKVVSETLGHASVSITADVYQHLFDEARAEAATAMEGALWG